MSEEKDIVERLKERVIYDAQYYPPADPLHAEAASEITRLRGEVERLTALASREGWVMVPVKPTEAMIDNAVGTLTVLNGSEWELARQFYAAMISSAPKPEDG